MPIYVTLLLIGLVMAVPFYMLLTSEPHRLTRRERQKKLGKGKQ